MARLVSVLTILFLIACSGNQKRVDPYAASGIHIGDSLLEWNHPVNHKAHFRFHEGIHQEICTDQFGNRNECSDQDSAEAIIGVLGASFTFGEGCRTAYTFPELLEDYYGHTVHNYSVSGYGYHQMLERLENQLEQNQCDILIVHINDILCKRARINIEERYKVKKASHFNYMKSFRNVCENYAVQPFFLAWNQTDSPINAKNDLGVPYLNFDSCLSQYPNMILDHRKIENGDTLFIDGHPNETVHQLLSEELIKVLNKTVL